MDQDALDATGSRLMEGVDEDAAFQRIRERGGLPHRKGQLSAKDWLVLNGVAATVADDVLVLLSCLETSVLIGERALPEEGSLSPEDRLRLRPVAETLAMIDSNGFFGTTYTDKDGTERDWHESYLPDAAALVASNGGWEGWPGAASFATLAPDVVVKFPNG